MSFWSITLFLFLSFLALIAIYVWYMSKNNGELKRKYGIDGPKTYPVIGTATEKDFIESSVRRYFEYKHKKIYATYFAGMGNFNVADLDMIRDILTRNFNNFSDRQKPITLGNVMDDMLTSLTGERWKHVRGTLSPTFSSGKIKRMSKLIEVTSKNFVEHLKEKAESGEPIELRDEMSSFTLDSIASTAFGINLNAAKDPQNPFITSAKKMMGSFGKFVMLYLLVPFIFPLLKLLKISPLMDMDSINFFVNFVQHALSERRSEDEAKKRNDFLQILVDAEKENRAGQDGEGKGEDSKDTETTFHGLTPRESQAAAIIFILAGYDTLSRVLSFTLFLLAMNKEALEKVREELDEKLGDQSPDYDNVAPLNYLDMCISEAMRLYPPGFMLQRLCVEDTEIQGFTFPKGYNVNIPVLGIHMDPAYWEEPEKFDPERFTQERRDARHPSTYMPFGLGPRNCIGMRLAQVEMKIGLAAILKALTPVSCDKTVYPIKRDGMQMQAVDGLWVKMETRRV